MTTSTYHLANGTTLTADSTSLDLLPPRDRVSALAMIATRRKDFRSPCLTGSKG